MADIVKMGKPANKAASSYHNANQGQGHGQGQQYSSNNWGEPEDCTSKGSIQNFDSGVHHASVEDEWPLPPSTLSPTTETSVDRGLHVETSNLSCDTSNAHSQRHETQQVEDSPVEDHGPNDTLSSSFPDRQIQEDTSGDAAIYENELYPNRVSYQPQHGLEHEEVANVGIPVASVTANLQKLNIQKEDQGLLAERVVPSVVIPNYLQAQSVDCSHLSFGSFRSGLSPVFPGPSASLPVRTNSEETPGDVGVSSVGQSDNRESEYYVEESLRNDPDAKIYHGTGTAAYESNAPQPEQLKVESPELGHESQYAFTSTPGYAYENPQQLNTGYSQSQSVSQMQNLGYPNAMPPYPDSLSSTLLAGNMPSMLVCKPDFWRMALLWPYSLIVSYFQLFVQRFFSNNKPVLHLRSFPSQFHAMPVCVITGATSGLGAAAAYALSMEGFYVVLVGRSHDLIDKVISGIKERNASACVKGFQVDVSSFRSMLEFKSSLKQWLLDSNMHSSVQFLINNAGILATSHRLTADGYDQMMATNYIGAFCLTQLLLPLLQSSPVPSRVVNITSFTHRSVSSMHVDKRTVSGTFSSRLASYPFARVYEYSKMCLLLFSYELNRQIRPCEKYQQKVSVVAVDPGAVNTNIMREFPSCIQRLALFVLKLLGLLKSPENAAQSVLDAVLAPPEITGTYFFGGKGRTIKSSALSYNSKLSKDLWDASSDVFLDLQLACNRLSS